MRIRGNLKVEDMPPSSIKIELVEIDSGGYDPGSSYWGLGEPLWCAYGETDEGEYCHYVRAKSYELAAKELGLSESRLISPDTQDFAREILRGLVTCAIWAECSEYDEDDEGYEDGDILSHMDNDDFTTSAIKYLEDYCASFVKAFPDFCKDPSLYRLTRWNPEEGTLLEYVGHDLWLTAYGSGFYDRNWAEYLREDILVWINKQQEIDLYLGDDGLIYVSGQENYGGEIESVTQP